MKYTGPAARDTCRARISNVTETNPPRLTRSLKAKAAVSGTSACHLDVAAPE
jgi:hypothetical protein